MEELLDAWTCFYRGQFAEAIRKAVTSIEVTVSDLLFELPAFRQNRNDEEVREHLVKMKFSDQFSFYLREDGGYSDPTQSVWHSVNKQMRDIFPLEPIVDHHGLRLVTPRRWDDEAPLILVQQIYT